MKWLYEEESKYRDEFSEEITFIAKLLCLSPKRIEIDPYHPCGTCIFIDGWWNGDIDQSFYDFMISGYDPYDEYEAWVEDWRNRK